MRAKIIAVEDNLPPIASLAELFKSWGAKDYSIIDFESTVPEYKFLGIWKRTDAYGSFFASKPHSYKIGQIIEFDTGSNGRDEFVIAKSVKIVEEAVP